MGNSLPLIGDDARTCLVRNNLRLFLGSSPSACRLLDLGCLEGGLSFEMAREGFQVLGVEGRESNYAKCCLIADYFDLPNLEFLLADVQELSAAEHGIFDVVLCCGLLYHLDQPVEFLRLMGDMTHDRSVLFLDTHIAPPDKTASEYVESHRLSPLVVQEPCAGGSFQGRWVTEYPARDRGTREPWAAVSNYRSFWLTFEGLMQAVSDAGFTRIYCLHGTYGLENELEAFRKYSRVHWLAVKESFFAGSHLNKAARVQGSR